MSDNDILSSPVYHDTMTKLEKVKRVSAKGVEYWMAREIHPILGYAVWDKFEPVIGRAQDAMKTSGIETAHHIAQSSKMVEIGSGATRSLQDYFLDRAACYLIAMNGDPSKPEVAAAQAYFAIQTRRMEIEDSIRADEKRLELRERVSVAFKTVSGVAKEAGLPNEKQPLFHDARYQGLYGMSRRSMMTKKNPKHDDNPFDYAGPLELSANEFQMNMATDVIRKDRIRGEHNVVAKNKQIARDVRAVMQQSGATLPENLPIAEPIKQVEKRLKARKPTPKALPNA